MTPRPRPEDWLPDARDGLSRVDRIVLFTLHELQRERAEQKTGPNLDEHVSAVMLYGRVVEKIDLSIAELQAVLGRLGGRGVPGAPVGPDPVRPRRGR